MNKDIYVLGIGHNTIVYIDLLEQCGYNILGLYNYADDKIGEEYFGYQIIGTYNDLYSKSDLTGMSFALSMGDNRMRKDAYDKITSKNGNIPTIVHPKADVSKYAKLGNGVIVHSNTVIHPDTIIGDNTVFSCNATMIHSSIIGNHCYIAGNALIGAYTKILDGVLVGLNATVVSGKVDYIGVNAIIGAGAVVSSSVESNCIVAGVPARLIKSF